MVIGNMESRCGRFGEGREKQSGVCVKSSYPHMLSVWSLLVTHKAGEAELLRQQDTDGI